jgi:hypothetical protein
MTKRTIFWAVFALSALFCAIYAINNFSQAHPFLNVDVTMNRQQAKEAASEFARDRQRGPDQYRQAVSIETDKDFQNWVELKAGGIAAFNTILSNKTYEPYTWNVRHYEEGGQHDLLVRYTLDGKFYGFFERLPTDAENANMDAESARIHAEQELVAQWGIALAEYEITEQTTDSIPSGRRYHTIIYTKSGISAGDATNCLRVTVSGSVLTEVTHFVGIPESFKTYYENLSAPNMQLFFIALALAVLLYLIGGCIIGVYVLRKSGWFIWRDPLVLGILVSLSMGLDYFNHWPTLWMSYGELYDPQLSLNNFRIGLILKMAPRLLIMGTLFSLTFMAAESLTRKAFPQHIRLWDIWTPAVAGSRRVLELTVGAFLFPAIYFAVYLKLSLLGSQSLGWWIPSEVEPEILATVFPWASTIITGVQSGFWEECMFRAIPIAGCVLLGQKYASRRTGLVVGIILQTFIFCAIHANYPQSPAYARLVVELLIPTIYLAFIYMYFGLLPAILLHCVSNIIWNSMPFFSATEAGGFLDFVRVCIIAGLPFWIIIRAKIANKERAELKGEHYNYSWTPKK